MDLEETSMASIFKRNKKRKNQVWWIQYTDHLGKRKTAKGFTDKGLSEELASKLETESRLRKTGLVDAEQEKLAEKKLAPIADHLSAFEASLANHSVKYVKQVVRRVQRIVTACEFAKLADINRERLQAYLQSLRLTENMANGTYNNYLTALVGFCNWCVSTGRLLRNPLKGLEKLNGETDIRHPRRALTPDEISRLVEAARESGTPVQKVSPEMRARAYTFAYLTGLRKQEMASLTAASFHLDSNPPTVTVAAAFSKHRRKDVLPLHSELVKMLREWLEGLNATDYVFRCSEKRSFRK